MKLEKVLKGFKPLAVTGEELILSRGRRLYRCDLELGRIKHLTTLPSLSARHHLSGIRTADRILRLSVSSMAVASPTIAFCTVADEIWRIDLDTGAAKLDFTIPAGRRALAFAVVENDIVQGKSIVFGDYFMNPAGPTLGGQSTGTSIGPVNVWFRPVDGEPNWKVLATFPASEVDHIHNIVPSRDGQDLFVLVGDTGDGVGFWKWSRSQGAFTPFQTGRQMNRSTWAFATDHTLIYATDTQLEQNYLVRSDLKPQAEPNIIAPIAGSSIYWGNVAGAVVFSSTVEPGLPSGALLQDILERRAGPGNSGNAAKIYRYGFNDHRLDELFSAEKDALPLRLAQFGSFMFPAGMDHLEDRFFAYGNAVKGYDNACMLFTRR